MSSGATGAAGTTKPQIESIYPLSPLQQGVLFHVLYESDSYYFQQWELELTGALDAGLLRAAWLRLLDRHPALRTSFIWERAGEPLQVVFRSVELPWLEHDWSDLDPDELRHRWARYVREDLEKGFDLSKAPLMRVSLVRTGPADHRMLWSSHHLILDGWSHWRTFDELFRVFDGLRQGRDLELGPARSYEDYIRFIRAQNLKDDEPFWRKVLEGVREPTGFVSVEAPADDCEENHYGVEWLTASDEVKRKLESEARRLRVTQNTIVQGAWAILCSRYAGSPDIVFGVTVSGRSPSLEGVESIVGVLINTLPVRVLVRGNERVTDFLAALQDHQLEIRDHQYSSLTQIQGWSEVPRGTPLFESLVIFENFPTSSAAAGIGDLKIREIGYFQRASYPLTVSVIPGRHLRLRIGYERRRFQDPTIRRVLEHFYRLIEAILERPEATLDDLEMISDAERRQIVDEWNPPTPSFASGKRLHETFEDRVREAPDATAVELDGKTRSYGELNRRANRLAGYLRARGVERGDLVGICVNRSFEMVVSILGVLKAGGAYVPLDPAYPSDRLRFMLADARVKLLLTDGSSASAVPGDPGVPVVHLDDEHEAISRESGDDPAVAGSDDDPAYVIYTSGSTGKPKGVLVTHRNVDRLFGATRGWFEFRDDDVWTLFHSYAFDFSVWELWGALRYGGKLVVVPLWVTRSPEAFRDLLSRSGVTVLNQTPSAFRQLIAADAAERAEAASEAPLRLRLVIFGGEALDAAMLAPWFDRHGDAAPRLVNMYGITETTVHVTYRPVSRADAERAGASVIGRPIPDLRVYALDPRGRLCPVGIAGELHVAGEGVARGYLNRPELTAERFVPDPFSKSGSRLYRSGDLGRYRPDGELEYLGRIDQQVKIRGHRIELGEIESVLSAHDAVSQAAVLAREDTPGNVRLVAYVVPKSAPDEAPAEAESDLRSHLKRSLPAYMLPSAFVFVSSLPLTPSGKIDRRALPPPSGVATGPRKDFLAPRDETERAIAEIWAEVLGVESMGARDSFFDRGGHSLMATQILSRVRDHFQVELPIRTLFDAPTVAEFAEAVRNASRAGDTARISPTPRIPARGRERDSRFDE